MDFSIATLEAKREEAIISKFWRKMVSKLEVYIQSKFQLSVSKYRIKAILGLQICSACTLLWKLLVNVPNLNQGVN